MSTRERDTGKMPPLGADDPTPLPREPIPSEPLLQFFHPDDYPVAIRPYVRMYADIAMRIAGDGTRRSSERTAAIRALLESLDALGRAIRYDHHYSAG